MIDASSLSYSMSEFVKRVRICILVLIRVFMKINNMGNLFRNIILSDEYCIKFLKQRGLLIYYRIQIYMY